MTDPTEIARVAAGLTRAQREAVEAGTWNVWPMTQSLIELGILKRCEERRFMVELTPLGLAVRDHILREKSGG